VHGADELRSLDQRQRRPFRLAEGRAAAGQFAAGAAVEDQKGAVIVGIALSSWSVFTALARHCARRQGRGASSLHGEVPDVPVLAPREITKANQNNCLIKIRQRRIGSEISNRLPLGKVSPLNPDR